VSIKLHMPGVRVSIGQNYKKQELNITILFSHSRFSPNSKRNGLDFYLASIIQM
jgi:hypothetical protein